MNLDYWAQDWAIPPAALADLRARMAIDGLTAMAHPKRPDEGASESRVQSSVRLEAAGKGCILFRNNVGALLDERGVPVRYGLANESKAMNDKLKSSDLIGIRRVLIGPQHAGQVIGQFVARECKHGAWKRSPTDKHEAAQDAFLRLVLSYGGDAAFAPGVGTL